MGGTPDDLIGGARIFVVGQEVRSLASGRGNACLLSVYRLGEVNGPVLKVILIKRALKVG